MGVRSESVLGEDVAKAKRFPIKLPPWHEKYLIWWAEMKGTSKTGLAQNVVQARVEANKAQIEDMLADRAKDLGISVEDLKAQLLRKNEFTPADAGDDEDPTTPDPEQ